MSHLGVCTETFWYKMVYRVRHDYIIGHNNITIQEQAKNGVQFLDICEHL